MMTFEWSLAWISHRSHLNIRDECCCLLLLLTYLLCSPEIELISISTKSLFKIIAKGSRIVTFYRICLRLWNTHRNWPSKSEPSTERTANWIRSHIFDLLIGPYSTAMTQMDDCFSFELDIILELVENCILSNLWFVIWLKMDTLTYTDKLLLANNVYNTHAHSKTSKTWVLPHYDYNFWSQG